MHMNQRQSMVSPFHHAKSIIVLWMACWCVGIGGGESVHAQALNENCIVAVLNRTIPVQPDGVWVLPNIPANIGQVRARATCVENGVTQAGQSDYFIIPANGSVTLPAIRLGQMAPIPATLALNPPTPTLTVPGATLPLSATATYPDTSTADVTFAVNGTNYTSSNPGIATVNSDGLVTAVASGTVLISALNEGALALLQVQVVLSGDSDGDGIPDDQEIALGLNPNDPIDGLEDVDQDGLTAAEEVALGTNVRVADSDGDGILDGEEVTTGADGFVTNPLLPDTDGDGIRDALEIATGSDPTDPKSLNLAGALDSLTIAPSVVVLNFNTLLGKASRQFTVTGHLIDQTTINVTSTARGTNYTSSDLTICNFGAVNGEVFGGMPGSCTVTATNNGFAAIADITVQAFAPIARGIVAIPGFANNVDVNGSHAFVAAGATGLQVVSISNPEVPKIIGSVDTPGNANDIKVVGTFAYIADGLAGGLQIIDISDPVQPVLKGMVATPGEAQDVVVQGSRAYVADGAAGLQVVDISNPDSPFILKTVRTPTAIFGVDVSGEMGIVVGEKLWVIDLTNLPTAAIVGQQNLGELARDVVVQDSLAYVANFFAGLRIVDFSDAANPFIAGAAGVALGVVPVDVTVNGSLALGAQGVNVGTSSRLPFLNIDDPRAPVHVANLDYTAFGFYIGTGIASTMEFAYLTVQADPFEGQGQENGSQGDTHLVIAQYLAIEDLAGVPPTVTITAPQPGASLIEKGMALITVEATDDVAVQAVNFLIDGQVVFTDTSAPYEFTLDVPVGGGSLTLGAKAVDPGNNIGVAPDVTVNVIPDPGTSVIGTILDDAGQPVSGATVRTVNGLETTSGLDGTFSIPAVPTIVGALHVFSFGTVNGVMVSGVGGNFLPVPAGNTDMGLITISGSRVLVANRDGSVNVVNADDLSIQSTLDTGVENHDVDVVPDGSLAVVTHFTSAPYVSLIDLTSNPPVLAGNIPTSVPLLDIDIACANPTVAVSAGSSFANKAVSLDLANRQVVSELDVSQGAFSVDVTPDGSQVVMSQETPRGIRLFDLSPTGVLTDTGISGSAGTGAIQDTVVSPDGTHALQVFAGSEVLAIKNYDLTGSAPVLVNELKVPDIWAVSGVAFHPNGSQAYVSLRGSFNLAIPIAVLNILGDGTVSDSGIRINGTPTPLAANARGVELLTVLGDGSRILVRPDDGLSVLDAVTKTLSRSITISGKGAVVPIGKVCP